MELHEYEVMAAVEDRHFWFVGTRGMVRDAVAAAGLPADSRVLDLGCGTGGTMRALAGMARFVGLDVSPVAAQYARDRTGNETVVGSATSVPFADGTFDAVLALDLFEHVDDDGAAVAEAARVLRPGGLLFATVPCHPALFSEHDRALHHVRRYTRAGFLGVVRAAGFEPVRATYINGFLLPAVAAVRLASRLRGPSDRPPRSDASRPLGPLNAVLKAILEAERKLVARHDLPFGLGLLVVARR